MNHRIHRSDEEWMRLITSCRQSGLSDKEWCVSNGIVVSSFYNADVRLRKKACQIPEHEQNAERIYDLTASSLPDVVPISVIPENKTSHAAPALQDAAAHYDNSHMMQILLRLKSLAPFPGDPLYFRIPGSQLLQFLVGGLAGRTFFQKVGKVLVDVHSIRPCHFYHCVNESTSLCSGWNDREQPVGSCTASRKQPVRTDCVHTTISNMCWKQ